MTIDKDVVVRGVGVRRPILTGRDRIRVLKIAPRTHAVLDGLEIAHGRACCRHIPNGRICPDGGAIRNNGTRR